MYTSSDRSSRYTSSVSKSNAERFEHRHLACFCRTGFVHPVLAQLNLERTLEDSLDNPSNTTEGLCCHAETLPHQS